MLRMIKTVLELVQKIGNSASQAARLLSQAARLTCFFTSRAAPPYKPHGSPWEPHGWCCHLLQNPGKPDAQEYHHQAFRNIIINLRISSFLFLHLHLSPSFTAINSHLLLWTKTHRETLTGAVKRCRNIQSPLPNLSQFFQNLSLSKTISPEGFSEKKPKVFKVQIVPFRKGIARFV